MLQESSIKKLNNIYNLCDNAYCDVDINQFKDHIRQIIVEVIRAESAKVKGEKFSLYNYVEKNKNYRPVMECVYHDSGYKVACDGGVLVALKEDYDISLEGRMFKQNGEEVQGRYPNWCSVIPKRDDNWIPVKFNEKVFNEWVEKRRAEFKAQNAKGTKWQENWQVRVEGRHTEAKRYHMFMAAAKKFGTDCFYIHKDDVCKAWLVENENGIAIIMPLYDRSDYTYLDL